MAQRKLTDDHKKHIVQCYTSAAWTQDKLAELYHVNRKTIYRVLLAAGVLVPKETLSPGSARIVEVVRAHGLDAEGVLQALQQPVLSHHNMVMVLSRMALPDIQVLFDEVVQLKQQNNGTIPNEPQLTVDPDLGATAQG